MALSYTVAIAKRYLMSRRHDGFISLTAILSMVSIGLGVAALIVVMGVMNGFRGELLSKILGYQGHAMVLGYQKKITDYDTLSLKIGALEGVTGVTPFTENQVLATTQSGAAAGAIVRGYRDSHFTENKFGFEKIISGDPGTTIKDGGVIIGNRLALNLNLQAGDRITIVSPKGINTPFGQSFRSVSFPVSAVVSFGLFQYDEIFVGMPLPEAQRFFQYDGAVSNIEIKVNNPEAIGSYVQFIQDIVRGDGQVNSWRQFNRSLVEALDTERVAMFMVLSLLIIVAVFNIATSLFMLVKDKAADIAILRTMGATRSEIMRIFMMVGTSIGAAGILLGAFLAILIATNIESIKTGIEILLGANLWDPSVRFISNIVVKFDALEVILTVLIAILLSFLATIIPARRAAKIDPVDILRYE